MSKYEVLPNYTTRYLTLFRNSPTPIIVTDPAHVIIERNQAAAELFAGKDHEYIGTRFMEWIPAEDRQAFLESLHPSSEKGVNFQTKLLRPHGDPVYVLIDSTQYEDQFNVMIVLFLRDLTVIKQTEEKLLQTQENLRYQARHDALTGLYNRLAFNEALHHRSQHYTAHRQPFALIMADLDSYVTSATS
jgi:PAS domain S-box-containing protein